MPCCADRSSPSDLLSRYICSCAPTPDCSGPSHYLERGRGAIIPEVSFARELGGGGFYQVVTGRVLSGDLQLEREPRALARTKVGELLRADHQRPGPAA